MRTFTSVKSTNFLANAFDWLGEVFEKFNPSAFRFLAAVLPYLSPFPVAWLTSQSSADILGFSKEISFIFVFALEGMGLWFTSLLVDSVVDVIRSRNWKASFMVLLFGAVVTAYIIILVNLNVKLEQATGHVLPERSQVITLICFLPLLTGIGNGYYKLKLEQKTEVEITKEKQAEADLRKFDADQQYRMERMRLKYGNTSGSPRITSGSNGNSSISSGNSSKTGRPSTHETEVFSYIEGFYSKTKRVPKFSEVVSGTGLPNSTVSRLLRKWQDTH